jgi:integrase
VTLRVTTDQLETLYVLAVSTSMRRTELPSLKWSDVDLKGDDVSIRRTPSRVDNGRRIALGEPDTRNSPRTIRLTPRALEALKAHRKRQLEGTTGFVRLREDQGLVITTQMGGPIKPLQPAAAFARLPKRRGCRAYASTTYGTPSATLLLLQNPPEFVQEPLGRATMAGLDTYSPVIPGPEGRSARPRDGASGKTCRRRQVRKTRYRGVS